MLTASDVSFEIAGRRLLDQVSLSLVPGELLAVIGPNGAGKSTLLRLLCGELEPSTGEVSLEGRPLGALDRLEVARRRAVLPQLTKVVFSFTAREIVEIGRSPHVGRCTRDHDRKVADDSMRMMGVERFAGSAFDTMSGGEQQRVHMARVLGQIWDENHEPRYLLLDEPTTSMDLAFQHDTLRIARAFSTRGVGVLAVLHDLNLAAMYADRVVVIHHGRLHGIGRPDEVITEPLLQEVFNLTACVSRHPGMECPLVIPMPAEKVTP